MICTLEHFIYSAFVMYRIPYTAYHNSFLFFQKRPLRHKKFENYKNAVTIGKIKQNFVPPFFWSYILRNSLSHLMIQTPEIYGGGERDNFKIAGGNLKNETRRPRGM
jgi:hypothetical protein